MRKALIIAAALAARVAAETIAYRYDHRLARSLP